MKFCLLMPIYVTDPARKELAQRSFASLARTSVPDVDQPLNIFAIWKGDIAKQLLSDFVKGDSALHLFEDVEQPNFIGGIDQSLCWVMENGVLFWPEFTHAIILSDDMLFHPNWFVETKALVERHPDAKAWTTHRSAYTEHHRTIGKDGDDHLVSSIAGHGMCFSVEEWKAWGVKASDGQSWPVPTGGNTLDLHHAWARPGERWATDKSWIEHLGDAGVHTHAGVSARALNFVQEQ